jgi:hypothetical protein
MLMPKTNHADPKIWTFATGDKSEIENLTREFSGLCPGRRRYDFTQARNGFNHWRRQNRKNLARQRMDGCGSNP